jgi:hypothetical protein
MFIRDLRCVGVVGEYSWGLKVHNKSFLGVLRVYYEGLRSSDAEKCVVMLQSGIIFQE